MPTKNLQISLPNKVWEIIDKDLNLMGATKSERIQNIIISSILVKNNTLKTDLQEIQQIRENIGVIEDVISMIIDLHVMDATKDCMKNEISK
jgi:hypothetical protein